MTGSGFLTSEPSIMPGTGNRLEEFEGPPTEEVAADKATEYFASSLPFSRACFQTQTDSKSLFQPLEGRRGIKSYPGTQGFAFVEGHGRLQRTSLAPSRVTDPS